MATRSVIVFLAKAVSVFAFFLWAWEWLGVADAYHTALAGVLDAVYPVVDITGAVAGVTASEGNFVVKLAAAGQRFGLSIVASDITSNVATLLALYLASPILRYRRAFAGALSAALLVLALAHGVTVMTVGEEALMTHPLIQAENPFSAAQVYWIPRYNVFYEEMGMYLLVLLLWLPYGLRFILPSRRARTQAASSR